MKYKSLFKKDVEAVCKKLRWEFYVNDYKMTLVYNTEQPERDDDKVVLATIDIDDVYLTFRITIQPELQNIWDKDEDQFFECLVHEFSHFITEPLYDLAVPGISGKEEKNLLAVRERQTQKITNMLVDHLKKSIFKPKKNERRRNTKSRKRSIRR